MQVHDIINTLKIGDNTSVIINDKGKDIKNGIGVLDEKGQPYIVLSVGMNKAKGSIRTTTLLIKGHFDSRKTFII